MSSSGGLRASLHYVGGIIFLKCSLSLSLSLALHLSICLALPLYSFSLILCRVGVPERDGERRLIFA